MQRVTIAEAAEILGVTRDAVRKRIKRDSIRYETDEAGETYVYVDASETVGDSVSDASGHDERDMLIEFLRSELALWQEEARRKDHLLAAALERIPEIEPPPDARDGREAASEAPGGVEVGPEQEEAVSWWRRLFLP
jgi:hypothetical protein